MRKTPLNPRAVCNSRCQKDATPARREQKGSPLENTKGNGCGLLPHEYRIMNPNEITNILNNFNRASGIKNPDKPPTLDNPAGLSERHFLSNISPIPPPFLFLHFLSQNVILQKSVKKYCTKRNLPLPRCVAFTSRPQANMQFLQNLRAVGSLVVRASDSRPKGLRSMPDATK
ncbi:hypothetical protein TNCV_3834631 [Trichonephila clavipes]|nr:hypothetical protein TNCV_3834631 [Trichonephila clavipes]